MQQSGWPPINSLAKTKNPLVDSNLLLKDSNRVTLRSGACTEGQLEMKKMLLASIGILLLVGLLILAATLHVGDRSGARIDAEEHTSIIRSPNWNSDRHRFDNKLKRIDGSFFEMSRKYFFGGSTYRQPSTPINTASLTADSFAPMPPNDLRVTWFGHSSFLIEIESLNVLIDPVWGERASPFTFAAQSASSRR